MALGENILTWTITNSCNTSFAELIINNTGQCEDEDSVSNELLFYVPNSFTPDSFDDLNSVFQSIFTSGYDPLNFSLLIFDRWGELVFETYDLEKGWRGTYGETGDVVQDGVYTWKIEFKEKDIDKKVQVMGHVLLTR